MADSWRTVPVFISSTFRDMHAERDHLVRFVFPRLRDSLLRRRIHLVDIDLRWGVTSEQDTLEVCREIIDECQPHFLCMLGGRYGWTPPGRNQSITADEVYYAAIESVPHGGYHSFYFRDPRATAAMIEEVTGEFREPPGSENERKVEKLKQLVVKAGFEPFVYPAKWDDGQKMLVGLEAFGERVFTDILASIDDEFGAEISRKPDEFDDENTAMDDFVAERVERYVVGNRQAVLDSMAKFADGEGEPSTLVITGQPGSGKSTLLGKFYQDYAAAHLDVLVVPHFVGASTGSSDVCRTLRRFCRELGELSGSTESIPFNYEELSPVFEVFLRKAAGSRRVVLIIDALDQLDEINPPFLEPHEMRWLPRELPDNVRVIVSSLKHRNLECLRTRGERVVEVNLEELAREDAVAIVEKFLKRYRKRMSQEQVELLLAKPKGRNPLYLLVALEELRTLGNYDEITNRIGQLPGDVRELFRWVLRERLSRDPGFRDAKGNVVASNLVRKLASFLGVSHRGLTQAELVELIEPGDPRSNIVALLRLLRPYLMWRGELLDFYHGQFRDAVEDEYLDLELEHAEFHQNLAEYFSQHGYSDEHKHIQILVCGTCHTDVAPVAHFPDVCGGCYLPLVFSWVPRTYVDDGKRSRVMGRDEAEMFYGPNDRRDRNRDFGFD